MAETLDETIRKKYAPETIGNGGSTTGTPAISQAGNRLPPSKWDRLQALPPMNQRPNWAATSEDIKKGVGQPMASRNRASENGGPQPNAGIPSQSSLPTKAPSLPTGAPIFSGIAALTNTLNNIFNQQKQSSLPVPPPAITDALIANKSPLALKPPSISALPFNGTEETDQDASGNTIGKRIQSKYGTGTSGTFTSKRGPSMINGMPSQSVLAKGRRELGLNA